MTLHVPFVDSVNYATPIGELALEANSLARNGIDSNNSWRSYSCQPSVSFVIGHATDFILLKYFVSEKTSGLPGPTPTTPSIKIPVLSFLFPSKTTGPITIWSSTVSGSASPDMEKTGQTAHYYLQKLFKKFAFIPSSAIIMELLGQM